MDHRGESTPSNQERGRLRANCYSRKLYISCRVTTLAAAVAQMAGFDMTSSINCKVPFPCYEIFTEFVMLTYLLPDLAGHCAGRSLVVEQLGVSTTKKYLADIRKYFNNVSSGTLRAAKVRRRPMTLACPLGCDATGLTALPSGNVTPT